jgi:hypothetical protein
MVDVENDPRALGRGDENGARREASWRAVSNTVAGRGNGAMVERWRYGCCKLLH